MEKVKRFLIFEGISQYGALHVMMDKLEQYLKNNTHMEINRISTETDDIIPEFWKENYDYIFVVQAIWFENIINNKSIYEYMDTKILGWIVDPPYFHTKRIDSSGENMIIACVDEGDTYNVKKIYKKKAETLHLFGIEFDHKKRISDRKIEVFVPGSYYCVEEIDTQLQKSPDILKNLIQSVINKMIFDCNQTLTDAIRSVYKDEYDLEISTQQLYEFMTDFGRIIDKYYRNYLREKCVLSILANDINITVCGMGWDKFKEKNNITKNFEILDTNMSYLDVLKAISDSKVVLNVSPFFIEGIHDRVSNAMLNGAVSLSDRSGFLTENFNDREEILYYSWNRLDASIKSIKKYLSDDDKLQNIADRAYLKANDKLTVKEFSNNIKNIFENSF
jgi:hypothetical protein